MAAGASRARFAGGGGGASPACGSSTSELEWCKVRDRRFRWPLVGAVGVGLSAMPRVGRRLRSTCVVLVIAKQRQVVGGRRRCLYLAAFDGRADASKVDRRETLFSQRVVVPSPLTEWRVDNLPSQSSYEPRHLCNTLCAQSKWKHEIV